MEEGVAQLEPRIAKVESDVGYISSRVANIEIELRDMRKSMDQRWAIRAEAKEESIQVRGKLDQLWHRISNLQLMIMLIGIEVVLVSKGSQLYQLLLQWISHFK